MNRYELQEDIYVFGITAAAFREGIPDAFNQLQELLNGQQGRHFFGLSYPQDKGMTYIAAVQEAYPGEAAHYGHQVHVIRKGMYLVETLQNWLQHVDQIPAIFEKLGNSGELLSPPCIEWYRGDDLVGMLRLDEDKE